jgi:TatD DNase family protein
MFYDTHAHFDLLLDKAGDHYGMSAMLQRAADTGVTNMLAVGGTPAANKQALALARQYPKRIRAAAALDRNQTPTPAELEELEQLLAAREIVAIGETGLDYHYGQRNDFVPRQLFRQMLALARTHRLPVIVHSRDADEEILKELTEHAADWTGAPDAIGVLHCFTGGPEYAIRLLDLGFYISFSGILTFKKAEDIRAAAAIVPEDRLLLETDAPFLAPEPFRGLRNEPFMLVSTAIFLAEIRGQSIEEIAECTTANAHRLFRPR